MSILFNNTPLVQKHSELVELLRLPTKSGNNPNGLFALQVLGVAMEPRIKSGSIVIADTKGFAGVETFYVIRQGNGLYVKEVQKMDGYLRIISCNECFKPFDIYPDRGDTEVIGLVHAILSIDFLSP